MRARKRKEREIYIITMETESSLENSVFGAWTTFPKAQDKLKRLVEENSDEEFDENSLIDYDKGLAESDPLCEKDEYTIYRICKLPILG